MKNLPKNGAIVETPVGYGSVAHVILLRQQVKVKLDGDDNGLRSFDADEVAAVPGGRPKPGEPLPHVLTVQPKKKEEPEETETRWVMPPIFAEDTADEGGEKFEPAEKKSASGRRGHRRGGSGRKSAGSEKKQEHIGEAKAEQKPKAASGEQKPEGEKKPGSGSHRNHHRGGGKKPAGQGGEQAKAAPKSEGGEKKTNAGQSKPRPEQKPEGEKKPGGSHHRRNYHHKPKSKPNGGGDAQG